MAAFHPYLWYLFVTSIKAEYVKPIIWVHITSLVIDSLRSRHTHTCIKTHSRVLVTKKDVRHTSTVCYFTETAKSPFSTPHTSITTTPISIKFTYFMPSIYTTLHTKFEENWISSLQDMRFWKLPNFLHIFLLRTHLQQ